jgi:hypothetical protein
VSFIPSGSNSRVLAENLDLLLFILGILEPPGAAIIALGR